MAPPHTPAPAFASDVPTAVDVVIIGAGFAGLAAAQVLGRAQRRVLVLGDGPTRNAEAAHAHNVLTRDGVPPGELLGMARAEVDALATVVMAAARVTSVRAAAGSAVDRAGGESDPGAGGSAGRLVVGLEDGGQVAAGHVLLATGARDRLPDVPGLPALWGRRAHSCPFCDAEAYTDRRLLVLTDAPGGGHLAPLLHGWTDDVTVREPAAVAALQEVDGAVLATMRDGEQQVVDGLFVVTTPLPRLAPVAGLPLRHRGPYLAVDGDGRTGYPGLWAAGDCAWVDGCGMPGGMVIAAMADGARAAAMVVIELLGVDRPPPPPIEERTVVEAPADAHHGMHVEPGTTLSAFWEGRYGVADRIWSGLPNVGLVAAVDGMRPGSALDLGCGEGADAIWLAGRGWEVTGVDVAGTALRRARDAAAEEGVGDRVRFEQVALGEAFPDGTYDLVTASYLLSPVAIPTAQILARAVAATAPGGTLVVLSHLGMPGGRVPPAPLPTIEEQLAVLALDASVWSVVRAEPFERRVRLPDGTLGTVTDTAIVARRR